MTRRKKQGKAISVWMPSGETLSIRGITEKVNLLGLKGTITPGPYLSSSYIIRTLLKAYEGGLEVPGLPTLGMSDASDTK